MKEYYEIINVIYIHDLKVYGTIDKMGTYASVVKYTKDGIDYKELIENDEFAIVDEIVFEHVEEEK